MFGLRWRAGRPSAFGRYRLVEPIATGGMAVVYRAVAEGPQGFRRNLVIKRVRPPRSKDVIFVESLAEKTLAYWMARHPLVPRIEGDPGYEKP